MNNFSVTQDGKPLDPSKYTWDKDSKCFSTTENDLVFDFSGIDGVMFNTGSGCTFYTGSGCTFTTRHCCTFTTSSGCTFTTNYSCTFMTGLDCIFSTGSDCTFKTGSDCTFKTGSGCTFKTDFRCTFTTSSGCTFKTGSNCTFTTGKNCVCIRYDVDGVTELPEGKTVRLNKYKAPGYTVIEPDHTIIIDSKEIKLSHESFNELKKQLLDK